MKPCPEIDPNTGMVWMAAFAGAGAMVVVVALLRHFKILRDTPED